MQRMMYALSLVVLCASGAVAQEGRHVVRGRVVDEATGLPVPEAAIQIGHQTADSDSTGFFRVCGVSRGHARQRVWAHGYGDDTATVHIGRGDSTSVRVRLRPATKHFRIIEGPGPFPHRLIPVVDGVRVFHDPSGCTVQPAGVSALPDLKPEDVVSVEIIKGREAFLRFGPDAVHGAVLITTKRAAPRP